MFDRKLSFQIFFIVGKKGYSSVIVKYISISPCKQGNHFGGNFKLNCEYSSTKSWFIINIRGFVIMWTIPLKTFMEIKIITITLLGDKDLIIFRYEWYQDIQI